MNRTSLGLVCMFCVLVPVFLVPSSRANDGIAVFEGDQHQGIEVTGITSPSSHDIHTVEVIDLDREIRPAQGVKGIYLQNTIGENAIIHSGSSQEVISLYTNGASGIVTDASGTPAGPFPKDLFLNVPRIGDDPAVPGGQATVVSYSDIETRGSDSHGIVAYSNSTGYPASVINDIKNFKEQGFAFTVTGVQDALGKTVPFENDGTATVSGILLDENGDPMRDDQDKVIEHGTFVVGKDGSYSVTFSADEKEAHDALAVGTSLLVGLNYTVEVDRSGIYREDPGRLFVVVEKNDPVVLEETIFAKFDTFGLSLKPELDTHKTVFPDLEWYVSNMLGEATTGGSGGTVTVNSDGTIEIFGEKSHGINAYSIGGKGAPGKDSTFYLFWESAPTPGGGGKSPGSIDVTADGVIITHLDESSGISAVSAGGAGGAGGDGVGYRDGRPGGTGGDGGMVEVHGGADIETQGDYSSGILALSVGGDGGAGGSTGGAMSGGKGGFGGRGGRVIVDGDWNVTTTGDKSHGIWAKSLGGNAGNGGSGGWLFGDPGAGGQATDGGQVSLLSGGDIDTDGLSSYGLYAQSVGGFGGSGGSSWGLFWSFGGNADSGGSGGDVDVTNLAGASITTRDQFSHAIFAQSVGGGGGSGGGEFGLLASLGGKGASGGNGGDVSVMNNGTIETFETCSFGIFAQSVGGGGGDGGSVSGLVALGGAGSKTSDGGNVSVTNSGTITTHGELSHAVFAESIGGGGGNGGRAGGLFSVGGDGGSGGNAGTVTVINRGGLKTEKKESYGIFAQSVGGGGGSGGGAVSLTSGVGVSLGGKGAQGGDGSPVKVTSEQGSSIDTKGERSYGIFAQSVGGGGGDGGFAITAGTGSLVSVAVGGKGGKGGDADIVDVTMDGDLTTLGEQAYGILAQSVGGGGGTGGFAVAGSCGGSGINVNIGLGGDGGVGGSGKAVSIDMNGSIDTSGGRAHGIFAQSVGGGGGDGGFAVAGSIAGGTSVNLAMGGDGSGGGEGGNVNVAGTGSITTRADDAHGILAQSVGGSGGNGGFSIAGSVGGGIGLDLAFGGEGGSGSSSGDVNIGSVSTPLKGQIVTEGDLSYGILAQSVGGGGGAGGATISASLLSPAAISLGFGGKGGAGSTGGSVNLYNDSFVHTDGVQSHGILAQSVGGGGGAGGMSISGGVTAFGGLALAMGGDGAGGGDGGNVTLVNSGTILTEDEYSYGIFAQSVGGGGGSGGSSGAVMANFSSLLPIPPQYPTGSINVSLSLGGDGGFGGLAGIVDIYNDGLINTHGENSYGIFAQSVGGGGGDGGKAIAVTANISMPEDPGTGEEKPQLEVQVDFAMALGGDGGIGSNGNTVIIGNAGTIETFGVGAHGIFAQSVGGGGGSGGDARSMILSIDPSNWSQSDPPPDPTSISAGATMSIGGDGAAAGDGGEIIVTNEGAIITHAADAYGILAQSVGGGGGIGGNGYHGLDWEDFGVPEELVPLADLLPVQDEGDVHIAVGGRGGNSGSGKKVFIDNKGLIETYGDGSIGILAQSIGGGGGIGGSGATGGDGTVTVGGGGDGGAAGNGGEIDIDLTGDIITRGVAAHGVLAQSIGGGGGIGGNADKGITDFGINIAMAGSGGKAGNGGDISIDSAGNITTSGTGAIGIYAQSVGGGGGLAGEIGEGFGFAGSAGGTGDAGRVEVIHTGDIKTYGENAHGIFAQSVGGTDYGGEVYIKVAGDISVYGEGARAVIAQSEGAAGRKNVNFIYESGTITGGESSSVGFFGGSENTFTNRGTVTTVSGAPGTAMSGTTGNEIIHNHGQVTGSVDLGAGLNSFFNYAGAVLNSGSVVYLGPAATLVNQGTLSPGSSGIVGTTTLTGNLQQEVLSMFEIDLDMRSEQSDLVCVTGEAQVNGKAIIKPVNSGFAAPGTMETAILTADSGVTNAGLELQAEQSAVMAYDLLFPNRTDVSVKTTMDASPKGLTEYQAIIGSYINRLQAAGAPGFAPFAQELFALPDLESLGAAYEALSPLSYGLFTGATIEASGQYTSTLVKRMHSVRLAVQTIDKDASVAQVVPNSAWAEGISNFTDQRSSSGVPGYTSKTGGGVIGFDHLFNEGFLAGISAGYTDTDVNIKSSSGSGDIDSLFGSLYCSVYNDRWYVDLAAMYGSHDYDNFREVTVGDLTGLAKSSHSADMWSAYVESGINRVHRNWLFQPFAALRYTALDENGYRESGVPGANLIIEDQSTESLLLNLGIRLSHPYIGKKWTLLPELELAWNHDFDIDPCHFVAAFDSAPVYKFTMESPGKEKDGLIVGARFTAISMGNISLSLNYKGEFRQGFDSHSLTGGIRIEF